MKDKKDLKTRIFEWVCNNPGKDAEDVAIKFEISDPQAINIVGELLEEGLLDFDE